MSRQPLPQRRSADRRRRVIVLTVLLGVLVLCAAIPIAGWLISRPTSTAATPGVVDSKIATLTIAHSPEKAALLRGLVTRFNGLSLKTPDRQSMRVELVELTPEDMVSQALGAPAFQALTPDSSLWLDQLNARWLSSQPKVEPGQIQPRLVGEPIRYAVSPIVIAAWEETARGLGWPGNAVGWGTLQDKARKDPNFKWNHASTAHASGLLATLAEFYAGAGVQRGLTEALAQDPKTLEFVAAVEKTVRYYGESELPVAQRAAKEGAAYLDAFVVSEQTVIAFNTGVFGKAPGRLVALYPAEGTLWADHPLALLETPELSANQRRTFQALREFLAKPDSQAEILKAGYRPADLNMPLDGAGSPLTAANGVDSRQPQTTLQLPTAAVVSVVQNAWSLTKRKTNVVLVVDTSGSMQGEKLRNAKDALRTFLAAIPSDQERVGLVEFNSSIANVIELDTLQKDRAILTEHVNQLEAGGDTALLDAVRTAYSRLQREGDKDRINAIVAMTDGRENASKVGLRQLTTEIKAGNQKLPVVIFAIGYGKDADYALLQSLADASGGQARAGTPETIKDLYKLLSNYF